MRKHRSEKSAEVVVAKSKPERPWRRRWTERRGRVARAGAGYDRRIRARQDHGALPSRKTPQGTKRSCQPVVRRTVWLSVHTPDGQRAGALSGAPARSQGRAIDLFLARRGAGLDWRNHAAATSAGCADQDREGSLGSLGGVGDLAQPCIRGAGGLWQDGIGRTPTALAADSQQERRPPAGQKHMPRQGPRGMGLDPRSAHRVGGHLRGRTRAARTEPSLGRAKCARSAVPVAGSCRLRTLWLCVLRQTSFPGGRQR